MKWFQVCNKILSAMLPAFLLSAVLLVLAEWLHLLSSRLSGDFYTVTQALSARLLALVPYAFCFFLTQILSKGKRGFKGFWCVVCLSLLLGCAQAFGSFALCMVAAFLTAALCLYCFDRFPAWGSVPLTAALCSLLGALFGYLNEALQNGVMLLGKAVADKGVLSAGLFALFDGLFTLFDISAFREAIFFKSYGGALLYDGELITGVQDLFAEGYTGAFVSTYLSGHYFVLFAAVGMAAALAAQLKGVQKIVLLLCAASAVLSGNLFLLVLYLALQSPFLYLSFLMIQILSYVSADVLELSVGYLHNGSVLELLLYFDSGIYVLSGGIVFVCIGYFVTRYTTEKHSIADCVNTYIPKRLQGVVSALGGVQNLLRFKDDWLEVRNPKLIDTLKLDCTVEENRVSSQTEGFLQLQDYI